MSSKMKENNNTLAKHLHTHFHFLIWVIPIPNRAIVQQWGAAGLYQGFLCQAASVSAPGIMNSFLVKDCKRQVHLSIPGI